MKRFRFLSALAPCLGANNCIVPYLLLTMLGDTVTVLML